VISVDTPTRLLRLLGLLSARAGWTGAQLADRLDVTERTLRRDITRLRELGYPIEATTGPHGGYQLGAGGRLPPLALDDDEAVAVAMALRAHAAGGASGEESAALSALTKLDQVLPAPLRDRVHALATVTVGLRRGGLPPVDIDTLVTTALCCRNHETLRFDYRDANDALTNRHVHPYRVVYTDRQWYCVAFDLTRDDWRTFRVDRMDWVHATGTRFVPVDDPPDAADLVARGIAIAAYPETAVVRIEAPIDETARVISRTIAVLEPGDDGTTIARIGGDADWIARYLASLEWPFELLEPDVVRTELHALAQRLLER
jgi:predicted DNA-binding transcriptional regulator YafY